MSMAHLVDECDVYHHVEREEAVSGRRRRMMSEI
jgi:hypothetical protein